jgi:hypothetical protein
VGVWKKNEEDAEGEARCGVVAFISVQSERLGDTTLRTQLRNCTTFEEFDERTTLRRIIFLEAIVKRDV